MKAPTSWSQQNKDAQSWTRTAVPTSQEWDTRTDTPESWQYNQPGITYNQAGYTYNFVSVPENNQLNTAVPAEWDEA